MDINKKYSVSLMVILTFSSFTWSGLSYLKDKEEKDFLKQQEIARNLQLVQSQEMEVLSKSLDMSFQLALKRLAARESVSDVKGKPKNSGVMQITPEEIIKIKKMMNNNNSKK